MDFLVRIDIRADGVDPATLERLRAREARRAAELAEAGHLRRLWRVPGRWANWGLWQAADAARLHEVLDSLPLRPYMTITVHPLDPHPSDPGQPSAT